MPGNSGHLYKPRIAFVAIFVPLRHIHPNTPMSTFRNPPFTIPYCFPEKDYNTTNQELNYCLRIETDRYIFETLVFFDQVMKWAQTHAPEQAAYFKSVRDNIPGLGPKLQTMRREWETEGYNVVPLIHQYLNQTFDIEAEIAHQVKNKWATLVDKTLPGYSPESPEERKLELELERDILEEWTPQKAAADEEQNRMERFQDALLAEANRIALEVWPELLNREPDTIRELGTILIGHAMDMAEELTNLAAKE